MDCLRLCPRMGEYVFHPWRATSQITPGGGWRSGHLPVPPQGICALGCSRVRWVGFSWLGSGGLSAPHWSRGPKDGSETTQIVSSAFQLPAHPPQTASLMLLWKTGYETWGSFQSVWHEMGSWNWKGTHTHTHTSEVSCFQKWEGFVGREHFHIVIQQYWSMPILKLVWECWCLQRFRVMVVLKYSHAGLILTPSWAMFVFYN